VYPNVEMILPETEDMNREADTVVVMGNLRSLEGISTTTATGAMVPARVIHVVPLTFRERLCERLAGWSVLLLNTLKIKNAVLVILWTSLGACVGSLSAVLGYSMTNC